MEIPNLSKLPNEILIKVFSYLPMRDHHIVGMVSKRFQELVDSIKIMPKVVLKITEDNIEEIKKGIENQTIGKFDFNYVHVENVDCVEDLEFIIKSIGKQIKYLCIEGTDAFDFLKGNVINLKFLELHCDNNLYDNLDDLKLDVFPFLEYLDLINNEDMPDATRKILSQLIAMKKSLSLKHLKLDAVGDHEAELVDILTLHADTLEYLHMNFSDITLCLIKWSKVFEAMENLKTLRLTGFLRKDLLEVIITSLPSKNPLEYIELSGENCQLSDTLLNLISEKWMNSLQGIELMNCNHFTDVGLMGLSNLKKLRILNLSHCNQVSNTGLLMGIAVEHNPNMEELYLSNLSKLDEFGLGVMATRLPNIRVLNLNNLPKAVTKTSLAKIFRYQTRLRCLHLDECKITDECFVGLEDNASSIDSLHQLEELSLRKCYNLTNRSLIEAFHLPGLQSLKINNCHKITAKGIEYMVSSCPSLKVLGISSTLIVDDKALLIIASGLKCLRRLVISNCNFITDEALNHIRGIRDCVLHDADDLLQVLASNCQIEIDYNW